jgi:hypothetical protein
MGQADLTIIALALARPARRALIFGGCTGVTADHCAQLELRASLDGGQSWPHVKTIFPGVSSPPPLTIPSRFYQNLQQI